MPLGVVSNGRLISKLAFAVLILQSWVIGTLAQTTLSARAALPEVFRFEAGQCRKFRLETVSPERRAYFFVAYVTSTTGNCNASQVLQSLPQDPEHFGIAEYDSLTTCDQVREPTLRGHFSTQAKVSLDFVPVDDPLSQALPYTVCTDTSWRTGDFEGRVMGPLSTYVFLDNTCTNGSASVAVRIVRSANVSAEPYCDRLVAQSAGILTVEIIYTVATVMITAVCCLGLGLCTACCSCWCCCARSGRCATGCSRGCFAWYSALVTAAGLGWIMDKAGGLTFYRTSQNHPLLFWAFSAACLGAIQIINLPRFDRDDTLNPDRRDSRTTWGPDEVDGVPAVRFLLSLVTSFVQSVLAFGMVPVVFSDPLRDPSFRSKVTLAGVLLLASNATRVCILVDVNRYYDLWPHKAPQIVLQAAVILSHAMATLTYFTFLHRSLAQRKALRAKLNLSGGPGAARAATIPAATVVAPPPPGVAPANGRGSGRRAGPVAEAAEAAASVTPETDSTDDPPSLAGSATLTLRSPAAFQGGEGSEGAADDAPAPTWRLPGRSPGEITGEVADGDLRRVSGEDGKWGSAGAAAAGVTSSDMVSVLPLTGDELDEASREAPHGCTAAAAALLRKAWEDVREEPQIGFRYSVFMSASLLIAAVTTTSSLMRAGAAVRDLAECTRPGSGCLRDAQRWVYDRFLKSLVRVDAAVFELQASGACAAVLRGDPSAAGLIDTSAISPGQTEAACRAARALGGLQEEEAHPRWLTDSKTPVLVGGFAAVVVAYIISMHTIYHVARAYKKLEIKLKAARLAEVLWHHRAPRSGLPSTSSLASDTDSASASAGSRGGRATARKARVQLGRDILKDYETVSIGQSAYFTGTLVSTCFFQLWLGALVLGAVLVTLLHPAFWDLVGDNIGWVISFAFILAWHVLSQLVLNRIVTDGKRIKRPFAWLFLYIGLSAGYCVVAVLLAAVRLVQLVLTSILALSRLDSCLFTVLRGRDRGYASFLAMALMLHSFQQCLKEAAADNDPSAAGAVPRRHPAPAAAVQTRWQAAAARAVARERTRAAVDASAELTAAPL